MASRKSPQDTFLVRSLLSTSGSPSAKVIVVSGITGDIDAEILEQYFSANKFGGPDVEVKMDQGRGVAYVCIKDASAVTKILKQRSHDVMGVALRVSETTMDMDKPMDKKRILIKGIPAGVTPDELFYYIEAVGRIDGSVDSLVHVSDASSAVLTFSEEINENAFAAISQKTSKRPLKGAFLSIEQMDMPNSILVTGFKQGPRQQVECRLQLYFESKKSKGGPVVSVVVESSGKEAIVCFEKCQDADRVLGQRHQIGQDNIEVKPFYPNLGHCESEPEVSPEAWTTDIPCSRALLMFLKDRPQHVDRLVQQLSKCGGSLTDDPIHPDDEMITVINKQNPMATKVSQTEWEEQCSKCVKRFLEVFSTANVAVDEKVWHNVTSKCVDGIPVETLDNLQLEFDEGMHVISIIGTVEEVKKAHVVVMNLHKEETKKHRKKSAEESTSSKVMHSQPGPKLRLLSKNKSSIDTPGVTIHIQEHIGEIHFSGKAADITEAQIGVLDAISRIKERPFHVMEKEYGDLLLSSAGKAKFSKLLRGKHLENKVEFEVVGHGHEITVHFYGLSDQDTNEAYTLLGHSLKNKSIPVEVTHSDYLTRPRWYQLMDDMTNDLCVFFKVVNLPGGKKQVTIYGFDDDVMAAVGNVHKFLGQSQVSEDTINISAGCAAYIKEHKALDIQKLEKAHRVAINVDPKGHILIKGPDDKISTVEDLLDQMVQSICKDQMPINQPGFAHHLQSDVGKVFLRNLEKKKKCKIYTKAAATIPPPVTTGRPRSSSGRSLLLSSFLGGLPLSSVGVTAGQSGNELTTSEGMKIVVVEGNIEKEKTDVIVSTEGIVSGAVCSAGGPNLKKALEDAGSIAHGNVVVTSGYNLDCTQVYHTTCPHYSTGKEKVLKTIVARCLNEASSQSLTSIAFPTIGAGRLGFPRKVVASTMFEEAINFSRQNASTSLKTVHFVVFGKDHDSLTAFKNELQHVLTGVPGRRITGGTRSSGFSLVSASGGAVEACIGNIKILVKQGDLTKDNVDIIVNTSDDSWNFGGLGNYIVQCGGQIIEDECKKVTSPRKGEVYVTAPGSLPFKKIYHVIMPDSKQINVSVKKCLDLAERFRCTSIAFPGIGTGNANVSPQDSARQMMYGIQNFAKQSNPKNVTLVQLTIYDKRQISAFQTEVRKMCSATPSLTAASGISLVPSSGGSVEVRCQGVSVQIQGGDITKDRVDIIVNTASTDLDFGALGERLVQLGGSGIKDELDEHKAKAKKGDVFVTGSGKLHFKKIYHLVVPPLQHIGASVQKCLSLAEKYNCTSITFPAIGTGKAGIASRDCAIEMVNAIIGFIMKTNPRNLSCIRVTVFDQKQVGDFQDELRKCACSSTSSRGVVGRSTKIGCRKSIYTRSLAATPQRLTLEIFAASKSDVRQATKEIEDMKKQLTKKEFLQMTAVKHLSQSDSNDIMAIENECGVSVAIDVRVGTITVEGNASDVAGAITKISSILNNKVEEKSKEDKARNRQKKIQWLWVDDVNDDREPFETLLNYEVECAYKDRKPNIEYEVEGSRCVLDFHAMIEVDIINGVNTRVERNEKDPSLPSHWVKHPVKKGVKEHVHVVTVKKGSPEFNKVAQEFNRSFDNNNESRKTIFTLERVQNPGLYSQYKVYNDKLNRENGHRRNERFLFHGTSKDVVQFINHTGFNRSFGGSNVGTRYGKGCYFARDSRYSAQHGYSTPDSNGYQRMYYARVLVGDYTNGNSELRTPPPRDPSNPVKTFNSVVDDEQDPQIFVVFYDAQSYPEYLITFK